MICNINAYDPVIHIKLPFPTINTLNGLTQASKMYDNTGNFLGNIVDFRTAGSIGLIIREDYAHPYLESIGPNQFIIELDNGLKYWISNYTVVNYRFG